MSDNECCSCDTDIKIFNFEPQNSKSVISIVDADYQYGFHCTKFPSMLKTVLRVTRSTPLCAMQIYISSPKSKSPPKFDYDDLMAARKEILESGIYIAIHGCLLYNLAGTVKGEVDTNYKYALSTTLEGLIAELDFGVIINSGVVVHPGARDSKFDKPTSGLRCISETIEIALTRGTPEIVKIAKLLNISTKDAIKRRRIILENAAGEGNKLCSTLEEIRDVINFVDKKYRNQVKVCIDTCHIFARGIYDFGVRGDIDKFYKDFEKIIGLEYLELFHFNDSMRSEEKGKNAFFGSRKDRHQQLGKGYIFEGSDRIKSVEYFMLRAREKKIALIGEPPVSGMVDWMTVCELLQSTKLPLVKVIDL
jgi:endonuclease IV